MVQKVPDGFTAAGQHLQWNNVDLVDLARRYGTPTIVYSKQKILSNYSRIRESFSRFTDNFSIKYAIKANSNSTLLSILQGAGSGADASSYHEVMAAINSGFNVDKISYTANNASPEELRLVANMGVKINFDSLGQFKRLSDNIPENVSFRIKSEYGRGEFKGTTTSGHGAKFGEIPEYAVMGYRKAKELGCRHFGVHIMTGSNVTDPDHFARVTNEISKIAINIAGQANIDFEYLDIGGGFGIPYHPDQMELDMERTAELIYQEISDRFTAAGLQIPEIVMEPGRYIVGDAGVLLGRVYDIKRHEMNYVGTDIGMNILIRPALYGAYHHIVLANKMEKDADFTCEITGQICENTDRIGRNISIPDPDFDDIVAVFNAGAYVSSMASNYNGRGKPLELLLDGSSEFVISPRDPGFM